MATIQQIIDAAARKVGITSLGTDETTYAIDSINNMIALWGLEFIAPYVTRESFALTIGDAEYTIGSGGDFDTVRPFAIRNAFIRNSDGYDYPLKFMNAPEYNEITKKTTEARPEYVYFVPEYPLAKIIFDCEPSEAYTAYFEFQKGFTEYTATTDTVTLPDAYKIALIYNLALAIAEDNSIIPSNSVSNTASYSRLLISRLNAISKPPSRLRFDIQDDGYLSNIEIGE